MNFATLKGLTIPEGVVRQITDASGRVVWANNYKITYYKTNHSSSKGGSDQTGNMEDITIWAYDNLTQSTYTDYTSNLSGTFAANGANNSSSFERARGIKLVVGVRWHEETYFGISTHAPYDNCRIYLNGKVVETSRLDRWTAYELTIESDVTIEFRWDYEFLNGSLKPSAWWDCYITSVPRTSTVLMLDSGVLDASTIN